MSQSISRLTSPRTWPRLIVLAARQHSSREGIQSLRSGIGRANSFPKARRFGRATFCPWRERKLDLPLPAADLFDNDVDRVTEPEDPSPTPTGERRSEGVHLEVVARHTPRRQVALEDLAEADEQARRDHARDLA